MDFESKFIARVLFLYNQFIKQGFSKKESYEKAFEIKRKELPNKLSRDETETICSRLEIFRESARIYEE